MIPIDPLFVPEINIIQGSESPVNIRLNFKNANFIGFSTVDVTRVMYGFKYIKKSYTIYIITFLVASIRILKDQNTKLTVEFHN